MQCLDAIEDKMQLLQHLQETVHDHTEQQQALHSVVERVETTQRAQRARQPPNQGRRHAREEEDDDQDGDFLPNAHKLEFPKFDSVGDPLPWLNRCERYIHVCRTPDHTSVAFTMLYLLYDAQLWFQRMELNSGHPPWPQFVKLVNARFEPPLTSSPISELAMLRKSVTVDEYNKKLITDLSCRDPSLTESQQVQLFITSLGNPLQTNVLLKQPETLNNAIMFATAYEQRNASCDR
jgi:hypothetical protein